MFFSYITACHITVCISPALLTRWHYWRIVHGGINQYNELKSILPVQCILLYTANRWMAGLYWISTRSTRYAFSELYPNTTTEEEIELKKGASKDIDCAAEGSPTPVLQWRFTADAKVFWSLLIVIDFPAHFRLHLLIILFSSRVWCYISFIIR